MSVSKDEYGKMADKASPPSPVLKNCCFAFLVGGFICLLGQIIFDLCKMRDIEESTGRSIVSMSLVLLTAILTGLGVFDNIAKFAGAGTMVPITGFANSIVSPAMEFKSDERDIIGLSRKAP